MKKIFVICTIIISIFVSASFAEENKAPQSPPSNVVTGKTEKGMLAPSTPFVGTVRFSDISSVAAESSGKILSVGFEEGDTVKGGSTLAVIDSELLRKSLAEAEAGLGRIEANLQLAVNDFERTEKLYKSSATSEQSYDNKKFTAISLEKQLAAQMAATANLKAQLNKKVVSAPYDGIVLSRKVSPGEWVNAGSVVADVAKRGGMDIIVNVPQNLLPFMKKGLVADVEAADKNIKASFLAVVPIGDVVNRTFPVKLRTTDTNGLLEGMEAKVNLPTSTPAEVLFVNRDAIVNSPQGTIVYIIKDNKAAPVPVKVMGYKGNLAGINSDALPEGTDVIVKGNERLRPDQPVNVIGN